MKVSIQKAANKLSKLSDAAANGEKVIITKSGKPYVELLPFRLGKRAPFGWLRLKFKSIRILIAIKQTKKPLSCLKAKHETIVDQGGFGPLPVGVLPSVASMELVDVSSRSI